jgi:hypothetical protein
MAVLPNKGSFVVATIGSVAGMAGSLVMIKSLPRRSGFGQVSLVRLRAARR